MPRAATATAPALSPQQQASREPRDTGATRKSATTVTVACKIPHGLVLQLCKPTKWFEETPNGVRERTRFDKVGTRVFVRGNSYPVGTQAPGFPEKGPMAGGYAMTSGIDADFFDEWLEQNEKNPVVTSGMIFAMPSGADARDKAKEQSALRSGLEPLDTTFNDKGQSNDRRVPKPNNAAIGPITTAVPGM